MDLLQLIKDYTPVNCQEKKDKEEMLSFLKDGESCFSRENTRGHFTASAWIVNEAKTKILFCYHRIYNSWSWTGGHADGEADLLSVAIREAKEETSVTIKSFGSDIFSLEILPVAGHIRKGEYVSAHIHYNLTFLITADENAQIKGNDAENTGVKWFELDDIISASSEPHMHSVYKKLIEKTKKAEK